MRYLHRVILATVILLAPLRGVLAADSTSIVISEIQTGTTASASQEFVELYNPAPTDVNLTDWSLTYKSATSVDAAASWTKRATLSGTIKAHGFYLIAPKTYLGTADADLTPGLAASAGHVRLSDGSSAVIDLVGWGDTANAAETNPAPAPPAGQSSERLPGRLEPDAGNATDTDDNSKDFLIRTTPEPQTTLSAIEVPTGLPVSDSDIATSVPASDPTPDPASDSADAAPEPQTYPALQITELLANPASPLTDASDEFIELYNPNAEAVDLKDYVLQTGSSFHDHYTLPTTTIPPGDYLAIYSSQSGLSLTNTGGAARLLDPIGTVVSQSSDYPSASEGQSWADINGTWQWTLQLTPGQPNVLVVPVTKSTAETSSAKTAPKKAASSATAKPKAVAAPKAAKTAAPKAAKATTKTLAAKSSGGTASSSSATKWLLLGALGLTIGYAIYEFRHDLQNYYYLARRKFRARA